MPWRLGTKISRVSVTLRVSVTTPHCGNDVRKQLVKVFFKVAHRHHLLVRLNLWILRTEIIDTQGRQFNAQ